MKPTDVIFDKRFVFRYTADALDLLIPHWKTVCSEKNKPSRCRAVHLIKNTSQKIILAVAIAVSTVSTLIFSLLAWPYNVYRYRTIKEPTYLTVLKMTEIKNQISRFINELEAKDPSKRKLSSKEKAKIISIAAQSYARSRTIYGPVVRLWAEHLLQKANDANRKLVFMARDGTAPYLVAKELMKRPEYQQRYPKLVGDDKIVLGYFSRKLIANAILTKENEDLFREYLAQELKLQVGDKCVFVDIGFQGSMVNKIRKLAQPIIFSASPEEKELVDAMQFEFLISLNQKNASGFLASEGRKLSSLNVALANLGVFWLEDAHQGNIKSPHCLVRGSDGRIYPNTLEPNNLKFDTQPGTYQHLLKEFNLRAIVDATKREEPEQEMERILNKAAELESTTKQTDKRSREVTFEERKKTLIAMQKQAGNNLNFQALKARAERELELLELRNQTDQTTLKNEVKEKFELIAFKHQVTVRLDETLSKIREFQLPLFRSG